MFGEPIYWYQAGENDKIRDKFNEKIKIIEGYEKTGFDVYFEASHAFLKSFYKVATDAFPDIKLIHVIRNPLEVAKSQFNREMGWLGEPYRVPLYLFFLRNKQWYHNYRGPDGKIYCRWALTGKEQIFQDIKIKLTRYQKLLVQWIEIENRAIRYLDQYKKHNDCYTLHVPQDLNKEEKIEDMFHFFNLDYNMDNIDFQGKKNKGKKPTIIKSGERKQLQELIHNIPESYLEIFQNDPYAQYKWINLLKK